MKDPSRTTFAYRDRLWEGADLVGIGVASFGHVNGVHVQNVDTWENYAAALGRGELPLGRAYRPSTDERLIREFILQMKRGAVRPAYFEEKYGADPLVRFKPSSSRCSQTDISPNCHRRPDRADPRRPHARRFAPAPVLPSRTRWNPVHGLTNGDAPSDYDVVVIGGGPAGSTTSTLLAQQGVRVGLFEREKFPRFHIGESLIPETYWVLKRLNMLPKMQRSHFVKKYSVQFVNASGKLSAPFYFWDNKPHECSQTWQVVRSEFDKMMLDNAREHGVDAHEGVHVLEVLFDDGRASASGSRTRDGTRRDVSAQGRRRCERTGGAASKPTQAPRCGIRC